MGFTPGYCDPSIIFIQEGPLEVREFLPDSSLYIWEGWRNNDNKKATYLTTSESSECLQRSFDDMMKFWLYNHENHENI